MERLARITDNKILPITIFAEDGEMVAFKYDDGGHGWAARSSFVPLDEAERILATRQAHAERLKHNENLRICARLDRDIYHTQRLLNELMARRALHTDPALGNTESPDS